MIVVCSAHMAVQRETVHADVPPDPAAAPAAVPAYGATWAPSTDAPRYLRGGPQRTGGGPRVRVRVPAIRLPRSGTYTLYIYVPCASVCRAKWLTLTQKMQMVQPMMPGMGPPPPGAYMPGPYMQPMHYPMPPPNGAYLVHNGAGAWPDGRPPGAPGMYPSPQMGQMPRTSYCLLPCGYVCSLSPQLPSTCSRPRLAPTRPHQTAPGLAHQCRRRRSLRMRTHTTTTRARSVRPSRIPWAHRDSLTATSLLPLLQCNTRCPTR